jgi:hypothetical protein
VIRFHFLLKVAREFDAVLSEMVLENHNILPATFLSAQHRAAGLRGGSPLALFPPFLGRQKAVSLPRLEWQRCYLKN